MLDKHTAWEVISASLRRLHRAPSKVGEHSTSHCWRTSAAPRTSLRHINTVRSIRSWRQPTRGYRLRLSVNDGSGEQKAVAPLALASAPSSAVWRCTHNSIHIPKQRHFAAEITTEQKQAFVFAPGFLNWIPYIPGPPPATCRREGGGGVRAALASHIGPVSQLLGLR